MHDDTVAEDGLRRRWAAATVALDDATGRRVLAALHALAPDTVTVRELATALSEGARGEWESDVSEDRRADLANRHLPRLDVAGLVEYDPGRETVALCDRARNLPIDAIGRRSGVAAATDVGGPVYDVTDAVGEGEERPADPPGGRHPAAVRRRDGEPDAAQGPSSGDDSPD